MLRPAHRFRAGARNRRGDAASARRRGVWALRKDAMTRDAWPLVPNTLGAPLPRRNVLRGAGALTLGAILARVPRGSVHAAQDDPLPSWNDGAAKQAILEFVAAATDEGGSGFIPSAERIATFDQDGTLWVEHPIYG